jgi:phosphate-selective porin
VKCLPRAFACALLALAPLAAQEELDPPSAYVLGDGVRASLGEVEARLRLRLHADLVDPQLDDVGQAFGASLDDTRDVRRSRALLDVRGARGSSLRPLRLRAQVDFSDLEVRWLDLYARYDGLLDGGAITSSDLRAGEFREPFGLEAMTSVSHLPFIERSTASNTFTPGRSRGAQVSLRTDHGLLQVGAFRRADGRPFPDELLAERALTARALWQGDGEGLLQAGGSVSLRDPGGDLLIFRGSTGSRLLERLVDTGPIQAERAVTGGAEALLRRGPWTAQAEAFGLWIEDAGGAGDEAFLSGGYASVSRFLGSGSTRWKRDRGALGAPDVAGTLLPGGGGLNAMEAVARLSWTDLADGQVQAGEVLDLEAGLNVYLSPTTRVMLHWIGVSAETAAGERANGWAVLGRLQLQL